MIELILHSVLLGVALWWCWCTYTTMYRLTNQVVGEEEVGTGVKLSFILCFLLAPVAYPYLRFMGVLIVRGKDE